VPLRRHRRRELAQLLAHFDERPPRVRPVEPEPGRLLLEAVRSEERGERRGRRECGPWGGNVEGRAGSRALAQPLHRLAFSGVGGYHTRAVSASVRGREQRAWVEVNLAAVIENARTVARVSGTRLLPVVKANAYGVGAVAVSKALEELEPWGYGVATVEEGAELRAAGITRPVVVFMPAGPAWFPEFERFRLTPVLGDAAAIRAWTARGERAFHVEIDTGMGRSGVRWDEAAALREAADTPALEGCYTQFHSADRRDGSAEEQFERFERAVAAWRRR